MKVAGYADANGLEMSPHGQQQVHVHLDCAVPNVVLAEFYPPQYDAKVYEAFQNPVVFNADGTVSPSQAPGAGLDINRRFWPLTGWDRTKDWQEKGGPPVGGLREGAK